MHINVIQFQLKIKLLSFFLFFVMGVAVTQAQIKVVKFPTWVCRPAVILMLQCKRHVALIRVNQRIQIYPSIFVSLAS